MSDAFTRMLTKMFADPIAAKDPEAAELAHEVVEKMGRAMRRLSSHLSDEEYTAVMKRQLIHAVERVAAINAKRSKRRRGISKRRRAAATTSAKRGSKGAR